MDARKRKQLILSTACALALGISTQVWAQPDMAVEDNGTAAKGNSTAVGVNDNNLLSNNTDNSNQGNTDVATRDISFEKTIETETDNSTKTDVKVGDVTFDKSIDTDTDNSTKIELGELELDASKKVEVDKAKADNKSLVANDDSSISDSGNKFSAKGIAASDSEIEDSANQAKATEFAASNSDIEDSANKLTGKIAASDSEVEDSANDAAAEFVAASNSDVKMEDSANELKGQIAASDSDIHNSANTFETEGKAVAANDSEVLYVNAEAGAMAFADTDDVKINSDNGRISDIEGGSNVIATTGSSATMTNSNNMDSSTRTGDKGIINTGDGEVEATYDSFNNTAKDHSASASQGGTATVADHSGNTESFNTITNTTNTNVQIGSVAVEVALSTLAGAVSNNTTTVTGGSGLATGANTISAALTNPNGITTIAQNTGLSPQVQQSVNVQLNGM